MNTRRKVAFLPALFLAAGGCTATLQVPDNLQPGANEKLAMVTAARGVQVYECRASTKSAGAYEWALLAPDAELFNARNAMVGRHGAGPHWVANDGSRIVGTVKARADSPEGAIPWLLLSAKSAGEPGKFSRVTSIQRVRTSGGLPPRTPCKPELLGRQAGVPYSAVYRYFTPSEG